MTNRIAFEESDTSFEIDSVLSNLALESALVAASKESMHATPFGRLGRRADTSRPWHGIKHTTLSGHIELAPNSHEMDSQLKAWSRFVDEAGANAGRLYLCSSTDTDSSPSPGHFVRLLHRVADRLLLHETSSGAKQGTRTLAPERYASAADLLAEWLADESGYDERVWPELRASLEEEEEEN